MPDILQKETGASSWWKRGGRHVIKKSINQKQGLGKKVAKGRVSQSEPPRMLYAMRSSRGN